MKLYLLRYLLFITVLAQLFSCKKEGGLTVDLKSKSFEFGIMGELYPVIKDENAKTLQVIIPQDSSKANLTAFFSASAETSGLLNNAVMGSQTVSNFSQPVQLRVSSNNNSANWTIIVKSESEALGLGSQVTASKSLNASYDYYLEQRGTGTFAAVNCGPTVSTMAAKWADPNFTKTVEEARNKIKPNGGGWYTSEVMDYLNMAGINNMMISLTNISKNLKNCLDKNYLVILCLDMYYVDYNGNLTEQKDKFYVTSQKGKGHYIVIKGYKMVDGKLYFEAYDPNSAGAINPINKELKGKNRYYLAEQLKLATENWWNYGIVVAPKNKDIKLCETPTNPLETSQKGG